MSHNNVFYVTVEVNVIQQINGRRNIKYVKRVGFDMTGGKYVSKCDYNNSSPTGAYILPSHLVFFGCGKQD